MGRSNLLIVACMLVATCGHAFERFAVGADAAAAKPLAVIRETCLRCHSTAKQEGEFDLERLCQEGRVGTAGDAAVWEQVLEQISLGEMPPKDSLQPTAADRAAVVGWIRGMLDGIARAQAGDPGPVVLRRLSNHEYTYSVRDLTGIGTLRDFFGKTQ